MGTPNELNNPEKRFLAKMKQEAEIIGYSLDNQQKDRDNGMSEPDIRKKYERYLYNYGCISKFLQ